MPNSTIQRLEQLERQFKSIKPKAVTKPLPRDPVDFAIALEFDADEWQRRLLTTTSKRILLNCSRQAGKSTISSMLAVHRAMSQPGAVVLLVSPTLRQSSELFKKTSEWFRRMPVKPEMPEDNKLSCTLDNGSRIISLPGSEESIRGFTANLIIEDEAARVKDALYYAIRPMLAVSKGDLVLMSTPFGKRGHFYDAWNDGGDDWERIEVPATEVDRISPEFLESERRSLGDWWFQQEYMCVFQDAIGSLFSFEDIQAAFDNQVQPLFGEVEEVSTVQPLFEGAI